VFSIFLGLTALREPALAFLAPVCVAFYQKVADATKIWSKEFSDQTVTAAVTGHRCYEV